MVKRSLNKVEEQIETNVLKAWYDNGLLLREIRDDKLYKKKYGTFEEYADQRWGWKKSRAYQMIEAAERFQAIEPLRAYCGPQQAIYRRAGTGRGGLWRT